jgi:hypothetical protein
MRSLSRIGIYAVVLTVIALPTLAFAYGPGNPPPPTFGAPGPIAGAGLPILAVGYGVYWLVRRRKSQ